MSISCDIECISKRLEHTLPRIVTPRRLRHIRGVETTALELASRFGVDPLPVRLAALAHDMERDTTFAVQYALASDWMVELTPFERVTPNVIHGAIAAERLVRQYGLQDRLVYDAVRHHTLGDPVLALQPIPVGFILYVADYCEPGRISPDPEERRLVLGQPNLAGMVFRVIERVRDRFGPLEEPTERLYARLNRKRDNAT